MLESAIAYNEAGISVVPIKTGTKRPLAQWDRFQRRLASKAELSYHFSKRDCDLAVICGAVSGSLEVLDFDKPGLVEEWRDALARVDANLARIMTAARCVATPSGGRHIWYNRQTVPGNRVLAKAARPFQVNDKERLVLIETRGEGGYVVSPPSKGYTDVGGMSVPTLTNPQCLTIEAVSRQFDETLLQDEAPPPNAGWRVWPGDAFLEKGPPISELLLNAGWTERRGGYARPGKDDGGISATVGKVRDKRGNEAMYVFSSNASPFESGHAYNRFAVYALLLHGGNFARASSALAAGGYGERAPGLVATTASTSIFTAGTRTDIELDTQLPARKYLLETLLQDSRRGVSEPTGVLPEGRVGLLVAEGGGGKTMSLIQLGLAVALGGKWLDSYQVVGKGRVFLGLAEEEHLEAERRFQQSARMSGISSLEFRQARRNVEMHTLAGKSVNLLTSQGRSDTWGVLLDHLSKDTWKLIVIDPLSRWGGEDVEKSPVVATEFITMLEHLTSMPGSPTVLVAHHTSKIARGGVKTTSGAARGTTALTDAVRWQCNMEALEPAEGHPSMVRFRVTKSNYARIPPALMLKRNDDYEGLLSRATNSEQRGYMEALRDARQGDDHGPQ